MMGRLPLLLLLAAIVTIAGCTAPSREGLPPGSPFAETDTASTNLLPQGIAMGDVTSQSALLWLRTDGPITVQVEWAPVAIWDRVSKMGTAVAPVVRTPLYTTGQDTDFTLTIPLEGLAPATRYRWYVFAGTKGREGTSTEARSVARGEFTTLQDAQSHTPVTFAWSGDLGGPGTLQAWRCRLSHLRCDARTAAQLLLVSWRYSVR